MERTEKPLWTRTVRRLRQILSLDDGMALKERVSPDLPEEDWPKLRQKIDGCLGGKGGEVSARARAAELGETYAVLSESGRKRFLLLLAGEYDVDHRAVEEAITRRSSLEADKDIQQANIALRDLLEPPRIRLLRQFTALQEGVKFLVDLRAELRQWARDDAQIKAMDEDVFRLFSAWFDVGFLELQQITWQTSAAVLERLIKYEAVHEIQSWSNLKHRLEGDRRCYAFFHPSMPDEPLIFVEVALVNGISSNIGDLLDEEAPPKDPDDADTAIFYSISNCQRGLAGVSFGNFLIKRVVSDLTGHLPNLSKFSTLSPIPGYLQWLRRLDETEEELNRFDKRVMELLTGEPIGVCRAIIAGRASVADKAVNEMFKTTVMNLCAYYLVHAKRREQAHDRVAHFHLTNGARIERINWAADLSDRGIEQSAGLMVNYLYDLPHIERNHEAYRSNGERVASSAVRKLLKT